MVVTDHASLSMSGGIIDPTTPVNPCDRVKLILGEEETEMVRARLTWLDQVQIVSHQHAWVY